MAPNTIDTTGDEPLPLQDNEVNVCGSEKKRKESPKILKETAQEEYLYGWEDEGTARRDLQSTLELAVGVM